MQGRVVSIEAMVAKEDAAALQAELEAVVAKHSALSLSTETRHMTSANCWNLEYQESDDNADLNGWKNEFEIWEAFQEKLAKR